MAGASASHLDEELGVDDWMFIVEDGIWNKSPDEEEEADNMAEMLLTRSGLPLVLRARVLVFLSTKDDGSSVTRAREAVRIMEEEVVEECKAEGLTYPVSQLKMAQNALRVAKIVHQKRLERRAAASSTAESENGGEAEPEDTATDVPSEVGSSAEETLTENSHEAGVVTTASLVEDGAPSTTGREILSGADKTKSIEASIGQATKAADADIDTANSGNTYETNTDVELAEHIHALDLDN